MSHERRKPSMAQGCFLFLGIMVLTSHYIMLLLFLLSLFSDSKLVFQVPESDTKVKVKFETLGSWLNSFLICPSGHTLFL